MYSTQQHNTYQDQLKVYLINKPYPPYYCIVGYSQCCLSLKNFTTLILRTYWTTYHCIGIIIQDFKARVENRKISLPQKFPAVPYMAIIGTLTSENCPKPAVCGIVLCSGHLHFGPIIGTVSIIMCSENVECSLNALLEYMYAYYYYYTVTGFTWLSISY